MNYQNHARQIICQEFFLQQSLSDHSCFEEHDKTRDRQAKQPRPIPPMCRGSGFYCLVIFVFAYKFYSYLCQKLERLLVKWQYDNFGFG